MNQFNNRFPVLTFNQKNAILKWVDPLYRNVVNLTLDGYSYDEIAEIECYSKRSIERIVPFALRKAIYNYVISNID